MKKTLIVCSGGQTGADSAALEFAFRNGLPHGGWCPKGRKQEKGGIIPSKFRLKETRSTTFALRTRWNCRDSDATVIFSIKPKLEGGTKKTAEFARKYGKPLLLLVRNIGTTPPEFRLLEFLRTNRIKTLNVAGPRRSEQPEIGTFVTEVLEGLLRIL
jgi:hypothetical protein